MGKIKTLYDAIKAGIIALYWNFFSYRRDRFGYIAPTVFIRPPIWGNKKNLYIYDHCGINGFFRIASNHGKFIMKEHCSVGPGLTVITANHKYDEVGLRPEIEGWGQGIPEEVIVNEDVWIGANVTLCPGSIIGRGCIVAAGSICIKSKIYPPYSIVGGNPAKFIKFRLSIAKQIEQERLLYDESKRIPVNELEKNYELFTSKIKL